MRIIDASLHPYSLPLRRPWRSARGVLTRREGWLLALHGEGGLTGWGDYAPLPQTGSRSPELGIQSLRQCIRHLPGGELQHLLSLATDLPLVAGSALQTALLDLQARSVGIPLARLLGGSETAETGELAVNAVCGGEYGQWPECVPTAVAEGYRVIKLKVGVAEPEIEIAALQRLSGLLGEGVTLRLDANGAWQIDQACEFIDRLEGLNIECLEEPLQDADAQTWARLQERCACTLALDETLVGRTPAECLDYGARRWVIKPTLLGGPLAAMGWINAAGEQGVETVITSSLESQVGLAMCAQVAALVPGIHGLATGVWFRHDLAEGLQLLHGRLQLPQGAGIGVTPEVQGYV